MCVLTYIPHADGRVTITHNRDEHILRPEALPPQSYQIGNERVTFPQDPQGGGTWFAVHDDWVCCLLNGGTEAHTSQPPYRVSRGTIITDFFQKPDIQDFIKRFEPQGIEPFTFLAFDLKLKKVHQLVWDERILQIRHLDATKAQIWSSSTLYNNTIKATRAQIFKQFASIKPTHQQIIDFHKVNINNDLHQSFFVNINDKIKTVAITQVTGRHHGMKLRYAAFYDKKARATNA
jgi:uncharacterized protein with NRDE domain